MLPECRFISQHGRKYGDDEFLEEIIKQFPLAWQKGICNKYSEYYELTKDRRRCNTWLRNKLNSFRSKQC